MVKSEIYLQTVAHTSFSNLEEVVPSPHRDNAGIKKKEFLENSFFRSWQRLPENVFRYKSI